MFISPTPMGQPGHCLASGRIEDKEGFLIFNDDNGGQLMFSGGAMRDALKMFGHATKEEWQALNEENAQLVAIVEQLKAELAEANKIVAAVDVLESKDFRLRKKPGPKVAA